MKIRKLHIDNFKSLLDFELINPNPFSVFVGPNGAGKSNIFEALEFLVVSKIYTSTSNLSGEMSVRLFGGKENIINFSNSINSFIQFEIDFGNENISSLKFILLENHSMSSHSGNTLKNGEIDPVFYADFNHFFNGFSRIFPTGHSKPKLNFTDNSKLLIDASNLEKVLKRILSNADIKEEFSEWLELFIPEFERIEVLTDEVDGESKLRIFEKFSKKPFNKALISDGTFNILTLLCAVFQSKEPQFLCIEEPENGLNPKVIKSFVNLFRDQCIEKGHYIWLNTHSPILVSELKEHEIIVVDKVNGVTKPRQFKENELNGMPIDEAWLTNTLGGGLPW